MRVRAEGKIRRGSRAVGSGPIAPAAAPAETHNLVHDPRATHLCAKLAMLFQRKQPRVRTRSTKALV